MTHPKAQACKKNMRSLFFRNSAYRTYACAGAAVDAGVGVDFHLAIAHADCTHGALGFTSATGNTCIADNKCHSKYPPLIEYLSE